MEALHIAQEIDNTSLGIIKPKEVTDIVIEPDTEEWNGKAKAIMNQGKLFGEDKKPLEKIPFKFSYVFKCEDDNCNGHKMMITDWELSELYRNMNKRLKDRDKAADAVKNKYLNTFFDENHDTHFFVGNTLPFRTWLVIGVFYPKRQDQLELKF